MANAFASLYSVVSDKDLSALIDAYANFKEATESKQGKKPWYNFIRMLKLIFEKEKFDEFSKIVAKESKEILHDPYVVGSVRAMLYDLIQNHTDLRTRKWSLDKMVDLFLNDDSWGGKKEVKKGIVEKIVDCASHSDRQTGDYAKSLIGSLEAKGTTKTHRSMIDAVIPEDLKEIKPKEPHHVDPVSTALITAAQRSSHLSLEQKIEQLKEQTLNNEEVLKELASYIPILGSRCLFDPKEQTFDLDKAVGQFMQGDKKVFLLLGDSGGGKSTYLKYLENHLWKQWTPKQPIPLFISLPSLKNPFQEAIPEALKRLGFTAQEQKELKQNYRFLFLLDGYDELKQRQNLYISNQLQHWKAQTIITCRSQYLSGEQTSYQNFFAPSKETPISGNSMDEASVSCFTEKQIEAYCRKFIAMHKIPRTWEQYQADIASIPDLKEIIETPFILRIICEVLPQIMHERLEKKQEQLHLMRIELFDAFVKNWFDREESRLIRTGVWTENTDVKKLFLDFATKLASEMIAERIVAVEIEENHDFFNQTTTKWSRFFAADSRTLIIRSGAPIRKIGPSTYAFIHKSLLEYFGARAIVPKTLPIKPYVKVPSPDESKDEDLKVHIPQPAVVSSVIPLSTTALKPPLPQRPPRPINLTQTPGLVPQNPLVQKKVDQASPISFENLNKKLLTQEPEVIRLLAECVSPDLNLQRYLFEFIECSKTDPMAAIAAANAITILNAARVNLSLRDFKGIRIPGADLSYAIITNTDLSYADLRNVRMEMATLDYTTLAFSETQGLEFGQKPLIKLASEVWCIALSPDGKSILCRWEDKTIRLLDCDTGKEQLCLMGHSDRIGSLTFSSDGKRALSGSSDGSLRLWNLHTGKELLCIQGHNGPVNSVAFSPDGKYLLSGSNDGTIKLWDCETGKELHCYQGHKSFVNSVTFSPDGKSILSGSNDQTVKLWDCSTGKELNNYQGHNDSVLIVSFSPDGKSVLSGSRDMTARLWNCATAEELFCINDSCWIDCVAFSPDGKSILYGSNKTVRILDCATGKELHRFEGHTRSVQTVAFSLDGKSLFSASKDHTVRCWTIPEVNAMKIAKSESIGTGILDISPFGKSVLSGSQESIIRHWDCSTGKELPFFQGTASVGSAAFSPDGKSVISGSYDGTVRQWDCITTKELAGFKAIVNQIVFSPDGQSVISADAVDHTVNLRDFVTGKVLRSFQGYSPYVKCIIFSPYGKSVLIVNQDTTFKLWDFATGKELHCFEGHSGFVGCAAFSPDGKSIISGSFDRTIRLWDFASKKELRCFRGHSDAVLDVDFSPDGKSIITGSHDKTVRLWDCVTGKELYRLTQVHEIRSVKFLPDGKHILVANCQPSLQKWQLFDEKNAFRPALVWAKGGNSLSASGLNLDGVKDLSGSNHRLLQQYHAINTGVDDETKVNS